MMRNHPRVSLAHLPTPLEPLAALSRQRGARLHVKRDDCTGLAFGGNKVRKLEFTLAHALESGHDSIITSGALQSNHVRQTAAACARLALPCHVVLSNPIAATRPDWLSSGNRLLDHILGAEITVVAEADTEKTIQKLVAKQVEGGHRPYVVPAGASDAIGSQGYVHCAHELLEQIAEQGLDVSHIVLATGSAGTHAGLLHGLRKSGSPIHVTGISVSEPATVKRAKVRRICNDIALLDDSPSPVLDNDIVVLDDYAGAGYALDTEAAAAATLLLARSEAILLDPVYTSKAFSGLLDLVDRDPAYRAKDVIFLHTGGTPALFACNGRHDTHGSSL